MDFDELKNMLEGNTHSGGNEEIVRGTHSEQVMKLLHAYAVYQSPPDFKPGDIVRGRSELTSTQLKYHDSPHLVMEVLIPPKKVTDDSITIGNHTAAKVNDLILMSICHDGSPTIHYADRREWEFYPESHKLKPVSS